MTPSLAAAASKLTVWEKLQAVPTDTWVSLAVAVAVFFVLSRVWKTLKELNDIIPWIVLVTLGGAIVMYWTYERNEPKVLSPIFDQLAKVLPSRIEYKDSSAGK